MTKKEYNQIAEEVDCIGKFFAEYDIASYVVQKSNDAAILLDKLDVRIKDIVQALDEVSSLGI